MPIPSSWNRPSWWHRHDRGADDRLAGEGAHPGLDHVLDALRAPASPEEAAGEQQMIAALAAERRRTLRQPPPQRSAKPRARTLVVAVTAGVALLAGTSTAVAARSGSLPTGVQERAHRLFSDLGVPAPAPDDERPRPQASPSPSRPSPRPVPSRTPSPGPAPTVDRDWCAAWQTAADGGHPMNGRDRRDLIAAAGGADRVAEYCGLPPSTQETTKPGKVRKSKKPKKSKG